MIQIRNGVIRQQLFQREGIQAFSVLIEGKEAKCLSYPDLIGYLKPGDEVLLNTTAVTLSLGTGGYHYVMANLSQAGKDFQPGGHIMKMRYTPMQVKVLSVEEEDSPYREDMLKADSLEGIPVLAGTLHSMLAPICWYLSRHGFRAAYVMTDGAALPIAFSNTVHELKQRGMLAGTVTAGHAFGGDLEAVNVYSGLLAARHVLHADVIICTMGPGIVGTGTKWGFTGIEQGEILNAVDTLQGIPVAIPRVSFADSRDRHRGISHHTLTVLTRVCRVKAVLPLPELEKDKMTCILDQLQRENLFSHFRCSLERVDDFLPLSGESGLKFSTMGRGIEEDREFFLTLGAAARSTVRILQGEPLPSIAFV